MDVIAKYNRRRVLFRLLVIPLIICLFLGFFFLDQLGYPDDLFLFLLVSFFAIYALIGFVFWRCPSCNHRLPLGSPEYPFGTNEITFASDIKHCPGCGVSLRNEILKIKSFLCCYDYHHAGGIWVLINATSKIEIENKYPKLSVFQDRPEWMSWWGKYKIVRRIKKNKVNHWDIEDEVPKSMRSLIE